MYDLPVPIFEYLCKSCGHEFEFLRLPSEKDKVAACPACASQDLEKKLTGFAFKTPELSQARVAKARAAMQRSRNVIDHKVAESEHIREHVAETVEALKTVREKEAKEK
jgi:putative FmdB family regulatory protein